MNGYKPIEVTPELTAKRIAIKKKKQADLLLVLSHVITTKWHSWEEIHRAVNIEMSRQTSCPKYDVTFLTLHDVLTKFEKSVARLEWKTERYGSHILQQTTWVRLKGVANG